MPTTVLVCARWKKGRSPRRDRYSIWPGGAPLGQRGDAPPMGSGDERATMRTAGDFGQVDRLAPISTAEPP